MWVLNAGLATAASALPHRSISRGMAVLYRVIAFVCRLQPQWPLVSLVSLAPLLVSMPLLVSGVLPVSVRLMLPVSMPLVSLMSVRLLVSVRLVLPVSVPLAAGVGAASATAADGVAVLTEVNACVVS